MDLKVKGVKTMASRKRIMRSFSIAELSSVDRPAQAPAISVMMKRINEQENDMKLQKIGNDAVAAFETLDDAINHLAGIAKSRVSAMREAARRYPALVAKYNGRSEAVVKAAAVAGLTKDEQDFQLAVDRVQLRDRCSRAQAMSKARQEAPEAFAKYQLA